MPSVNIKNVLNASKTSLMNQAKIYLTKAANEWLEQVQKILAKSDQVSEDLGLYSAMARRKLGSDQLKNAEAINTRISSLEIHRWTTADSGRLILLMTAIENNPAQVKNIITSYYKMGDESERMALIRGLVFFAPDDYLTEIALDAGRTNSLQLLSALIQDNPYPNHFYSEQAFNQMVLKGLFMGLAIERVDGLLLRTNQELARMGESYVIEREEANRSVPVDIWLAIGPFASEVGQQKMIEYLDHEDMGHRYYCSLALSQRLAQDPSLLSLLKKRVEQEREPLILNLLQKILQPPTN